MAQMSGRWLVMIINNEISNTDILNIIFSVLTMSVNLDNHCYRNNVQASVNGVASLEKWYAAVDDHGATYHFDIAWPKP